MPENDNSLLSTIPTCVLVAELKKRDKVWSYDVRKGDWYIIDIALCEDDRVEGDSDKGPAQIIVVRG